MHTIRKPVYSSTGDCVHEVMSCTWKLFLPLLTCMYMQCTYMYNFQCLNVHVLDFKWYTFTCIHWLYTNNICTCTCTYMYTLYIYSNLLNSASTMWQFSLYCSLPCFSTRPVLSKHRPVIQMFQGGLGRKLREDIMLKNCTNKFIYNTCTCPNNLWPKSYLYMYIPLEPVNKWNHWDHNKNCPLWGHLTWRYRINFFHWSVIWHTNQCTCRWRFYQIYMCMSYMKC